VFTQITPLFTALYSSETPTLLKGSYAVCRQVVGLYSRQKPDDPSR